MFKVDMQAIRKSASAARLTANLANPANSAVYDEQHISQGTPELATLAGLAISHDSSDTELAELIAASMLACIHHGDGEGAREAMRADCIVTPPHLRAELLDYFTQTYGVSPMSDIALEFA